MTDAAESVVRALAGGLPRHRGDLAHECAINEAILDEVLETLARLGVKVIRDRDSVALPRSVDLLDGERILRAVPRLRADSVHVRFSVDSTNSFLAARLRAGAPAPELCIAEIQTAGRGRLGRRWVSGLGQSLVLSVSWRFTVRSSAASGLSLAIGVALAEALAAGGFERVMLKWPNDLVVDDRKLAGILVEASHSGTDPAVCVIGVGFNVDLDTGDAGRIDQAWTDFARAFGRIPPRSWLASQAANAILDACARFRDDGLAPFLERWGARDALHGRPVRVVSGRATIEGVAHGIDDDGALLVEHDARIVHCEAGEVSVRALEV